MAARLAFTTESLAVNAVVRISQPLGKILIGAQRNVKFFVCTFRDLPDLNTGRIFAQADRGQRIGIKLQTVLVERREPARELPPGAVYFASLAAACFN